MSEHGIKITATVTLPGLPSPPSTHARVYGFGMHFVRVPLPVNGTRSPNFTWGEIKSEFSIEIEAPKNPPDKPDPQDKTSWSQIGSTFLLTFPGTDVVEQNGNGIMLQPGTYMLAALRVDVDWPVYFYAGVDFNADDTTVIINNMENNFSLHLAPVKLSQQGWTHQ